MAAKEKALEREVLESYYSESESYIVVDYVTDDQESKSEESMSQRMEIANVRRPSFRSEGFMTKIGRGVKSAVGAAVGGAINMIVGKLTHNNNNYSSY